MIRLSNTQMKVIYETIQKIRFFDYPSRFSGVPDRRVYP